MTGHRFTLNGEDLSAHVTPIDPDAARAQDLDCAHTAWRGFSWIDRPNFGPFAVNFLRERGLALVPVDTAPAEPPNLHVVFDRYRAAWQRDDDRARDEDDPGRCWFGPIGLRRTWEALQLRGAPLTPDGGIAPPAVEQL